MKNYNDPKHVLHTVWSVQKTAPLHVTKGPYVAMFTNDATGTEYFYGTEDRCFQERDIRKTKFVAMNLTGVEFVQQRANG